jgi:hypothetical protein
MATFQAGFPATIKLTHYLHGDDRARRGDERADDLGFLAESILCRNISRLDLEAWLLVGVAGAGEPSACYDARVRIDKFLAKCDSEQARAK